jgi:hypothetical protein
LILTLVMTSTHDPQSAALIHWEFERNHQRLLCAVHVTAAPQSYEVATLALWDRGPIGIERFESPGAALRHHAATAAGLREAGWTVTAYTP